MVLNIQSADRYVHLVDAVASNIADSMQFSKSAKEKLELAIEAQDVRQVPTAQPYTGPVSKAFLPANDSNGDLDIGIEGTGRGKTRNTR